METLATCYLVGLAHFASDEAKTRFKTWKTKANTPVYVNREEAETSAPRAFGEYESRWGRAGGIYREYPLQDGRVVIKTGHWWDVPEPGGVASVFYFA